MHAACNRLRGNVLAMRVSLAVRVLVGFQGLSKRDDGVICQRGGCTRLQACTPCLSIDALSACRLGVLPEMHVSCASTLITSLACFHLGCPPISCSVQVVPGECGTSLKSRPRLAFQDKQAGRCLNIPRPAWLVISETAAAVLLFRKSHATYWCAAQHALHMSMRVYEKLG